MSNDFDTILLDGDIVINKACFAAETKWYQVIHKDTDDVYTFQYKREAKKHSTEHLDSDIIKKKDVLPLPIIKSMADSIIANIKKKLNCDHLITIVGPPSGAKTFRHEAAVTLPYKGNRKDIDRPEHLADIRKHLIDKHNALVAHDMETDDLLGIIQGEEEKSIIASIDKDLLQIPGLHYNIDTEEVILSSDPGTLWILKRKGGQAKLKGYGFKWFCAQMLLGDSIDNISKPIKGLGPVKVYHLLCNKKSIEDMWKVVTEVYKDSSLSIEENGTLLWILRNADENWETLL